MPSSNAFHQSTSLQGDLYIIPQAYAGLFGIHLPGLPKLDGDESSSLNSAVCDLLEAVDIGRVGLWAA